MDEAVTETVDHTSDDHVVDRSSSDEVKPEDAGNEDGAEGSGADAESKAEESLGERLGITKEVPPDDCTCESNEDVGTTAETVLQDD